MGKEIQFLQPATNIGRNISSSRMSGSSSPMVHEARTGISTVTPDDGVVSQSAAGCLQWVCGFVGCRRRALGVQPSHGVHAFVPSMPGMVIAARLGPGNATEGQRVIWNRSIRAPIGSDNEPTQSSRIYTRSKSTV